MLEEMAEIRKENQNLKKWIESKLSTLDSKWEAKGKISSTKRNEIFEEVIKLSKVQRTASPISPSNQPRFLIVFVFLVRVENSILIVCYHLVTGSVVLRLILFSYI